MLPQKSQSSLMTLIQRIAPPTQSPFAELVVGQNVTAKGTADMNGDGVMDWTVEHITIGAALTTHWTTFENPPATRTARVARKL